MTLNRKGRSIGKPVPGYDVIVAMAQGWILADNEKYGLRIEKYDESDRFESDEDALQHVQELAALGTSETASAALRAIAEWRGSDAAIQLYLRNGGSSNGADCPFCGADNTSGNTIDGETKTFQWDQGVAWVVVTCSGCKRQWHENFVLDGMNTLDTETYKSWDRQGNSRC